jgi:hypothetical protein
MSVGAVERAAALAWSLREQMALGERVLSAGDGFSRRRKSAVQAGPALSERIERSDDASAALVRHRGGAEQAFIQVVEEENATVDLYRSLGCEVSHRYRYRRADLEGR